MAVGKSEPVGAPGMEVAAGVAIVGSTSQRHPAMPDGCSVICHSASQSRWVLYQHFTTVVLLLTQLLLILFISIILTQTWLCTNEHTANLA